MDPFGNDGECPVPKVLQSLSYCSAAPHGCEASKFSSDELREFSAARGCKFPDPGPYDRLAIAQQLLSYCLAMS